MTDEPTTTSDQPLAPFEERAEELLSRVFRGMHHVHGLKKSPRHWRCSHYGELTTYDDNLLTRLVLAAHEYCLRVGISQSGPGSVRVNVWERKSREGEFYDRHPTIQTAIEKWDTHAR